MVDIEAKGAQENGDEHETKRARISLKIKKPDSVTEAVNGAEVGGEKKENVHNEAPLDAEVEIEKKPSTERALSPEVRNALAKVIVA